MKQEFLIRERHPRLLLFFAGWGGEANLFRDYRPAESDFLLCSDYRSPAFDDTLLAGYREIRLAAWSMGVWMAGRTLAGRSLPLTRCTAVNGTMTPIDDRRGIPTAVFQGTLDAFGPVALMKFRRRMCDTVEGVKAFLAHAPVRPPEDLREELACIREAVAARPVAPFAWDRALVGSRDRIFPLPNQLAAWEGVPTEVYDEAHYSEYLLHKALEEGW